MLPRVICNLVSMVEYVSKGDNHTLAMKTRLAGDNSNAELLTDTPNGFSRTYLEHTCRPLSKKNGSCCGWWLCVRLSPQLS